MLEAHHNMTDEVAMALARWEEEGGAPGVFPVESTTSGDQRALVTDAMTRTVISVRADLSVGALAALFVEHHISGAPVINETGAPIGVVSKTDLVRNCHEHGNLAADNLPPRIANMRVADIMMPLTFSLPEDAPISRAAALMAFEGVHRLFVVSPTGEVTGILSALDVLRWLAEHDGYLNGHHPHRDQAQAHS